MANDDVIERAERLLLEPIVNRMAAGERACQLVIDLVVELRASRARVAELPNFVADVREFHARFGVPDLPRPSPSTPERRDLRRALILEEAIETSDALQQGDMTAIADGLADTIYVCIGAALELGIPIELVWREVHRTNMQKVGGATREDGKILKPEGWAPPDIGSIIDAATAGEADS